MNNKIVVLFLALCLIFSPANISFAQDTGQEKAKATEVVSSAAEKPLAAGDAQINEAKAPETAKKQEAVQEDKAAEPEADAEPAVVVEPGNVTVNFKGADIKTVLAYISEVAGVDIVPAPDVKGVVDLKLTNKPWKVALDIIVRNYGFAYEREGDIIRVVTIDRLKQEELTSQVFSLNYSKSKDVVESLKTIVSDRGKAIYDERTNTILVTDIPTNIYKIGEVVKRLDRRTDQVLIEARVIETVLDDSEKLGIDWNVKMSISGASRPTTFPFDYYTTDSGLLSKFLPLVQTGQQSYEVDPVSGALLTFDPGKYPTGKDGTGSGSQAFPYVDYTQTQFANSFTFGTLDFSQFKAVLELIKSRANTDIVSNPRIATLNNTEALINVGQTLNLPKYERNGSTGKMEITGYDAKDLGVILKVTPHVNDNAEIVIDLAPEISDLLRYDTLDAASGIVAPVFSTRVAKTKIMVKDGDTIFIGGLIKENTVDLRKKLPFVGDLLGDVPYVGLLFTKKEIVKQKSELIFFITVNLMVADKTIKSAPLPSKAYAPQFGLTQNEDKAAKKKRLNKR